MFSRKQLNIVYGKIKKNRERCMYPNNQNKQNFEQELLHKYLYIAQLGRRISQQVEIIIYLLSETFCYNQMLKINMYILYYNVI